MKFFPEACILLSLGGALGGKLPDFPTCFRRTKSVYLRVCFTSLNLLGEDGFRT